MKITKTTLKDIDMSHSIDTGKSIPAKLFPLFVECAEAGLMGKISEIKLVIID